MNEHDIETYSLDISNALKQAIESFNAQNRTKNNSNK